MTSPPMPSASITPPALPSSVLSAALAAVTARRDLSQDQMARAVSAIMDGEATAAQIAGFLVAVRMKGETVEEIAGAATAMRARATAVRGATADGLPLIDTCGTGGDGAGTFNVSTAAAFVVAGAGFRVAKHGNRSVSSRCGSADVLEHLGLDLAAPPALLERALAEAGMVFLFAPALHQAMRHAAAPRRELGLRTIFNLLGPLTNPAGATVQLVGVYDAGLTRPVAEVLGRLGCQGALVVHGEGGLDEISLSGPTHASALKAGQVRDYIINPEDLGFRLVPIEAVSGAGSAENAEVLLRILKGEPGPRADIVVLNAAGALVAAGLAWPEAVAAARDSLASGAALAKLEALLAVCGTRPNGAS
ncbi:MAG: anthranilate phosphoribosyltransferase [Pseudomonadota bacterium]